MAVRHRYGAVLVVGAIVLAVGLAGRWLTPASGESIEGGQFVALNSFRIVDTQTGVGGSTAPLAAGQYRDYQVLGVGGVPTKGVSAVVVDIAAVGLSGATNSYLRVYASDASTAPDTTMLRFEDGGAPRSNTAISRVGTTGKIRVLNGPGSVHFNIDVQGYFTTSEGSGFVPLTTPTQMVSTTGAKRVPLGNITAGTTYDIQLGGEGEVPFATTAVFANIKVQSTVAGTLRVGEGGVDSGAPATMNYRGGTTGTMYSDSGMSIPLSPDGKIRITNLGTSGSIALWLDVQGYFLEGAESNGGFYVPLTGARVFDSGSVPLASLETRTVVLANKDGLPDGPDIGAVALNILVLSWTQGGYLQVFAADAPAPGSGAGSVSWSNAMDPAAGVTTTMLVGLSDSGTIKISNRSTQPVRVVLSAQGWFGVADVSGDPVPDLKASELEASAPTTNPTELALAEQEPEVPDKDHPEQGLVAPTADPDRASAAAAVSAILTSLLKAGAMPADMAERASTAPSREVALTAVMNQVWTSSAAPEQTNLWLAALREAAEDPLYPNFSDARVVVDRWISVEVGTDMAVVTVNAHDEFLRSGDTQWSVGGSSQYEITLRPASAGPSGWQVQTLATLQLPEE